MTETSEPSRGAAESGAAPVTMLFDEAAITGRVGELAAEIARAMPEDFTIVGLLKGSFVVVADLARALDAAGRHPRVEFMTLSSYGCGRESSGALQIGPGQIVEVPRLAQHRQALVVEVEKVLEIAEIVGRA